MKHPAWTEGFVIGVLLLTARSIHTGASKSYEFQLLSIIFKSCNHLGNLRLQYIEMSGRFAILSWHCKILHQVTSLQYFQIASASFSSIFSNSLFFRFISGATRGSSTIFFPAVLFPISHLLSSPPSLHFQQYFAIFGPLRSLFCPLFFLLCKRVLWLDMSERTEMSNAFGQQVFLDENFVDRSILVL